MSVAEIILKKDSDSVADYERFDAFQLSFIEQAKQLKFIHDFLPKDARFRETSVMVKIIERLKNFLP